MSTTPVPSGADQTGLRPTDFVIFGGTGDLAMRKLLPALFWRHTDGQLPAGSQMVAVSRAGLDDAGFRAKVLESIPGFTGTDPSQSQLDDFGQLLHHHSIDVDEPAEWKQLTEALNASPNPVRVFYLAVSPALFGPICQMLASEGLVTADSRVVMEKPIGHDVASARAINDAVGAVFDESQIFRIDHYLGKESVQNLLVTRFANTVFEPLWNANAIDHVQITVAETLGVGTRGGYYDAAGATRDMIQNHLLQLLCLVAMEPPTYVGRETVRDEKLKVLHALRGWTSQDLSSDVVAGQYGAGLVDGRPAPSYREEIESTSSTTDTFVAVKTEVRNWRWAGVPFYLRTGKRMDTKVSEIVIVFKPIPHEMFPGSHQHQEPNRLVIRIQPDESIRLHLVAKEPGPGGIRLRPAWLDLNFGQHFGTRSPDAYERLLMDVVRGNPTLFMRRDEVEAAWSWVEPILEHLASSTPKKYAAGTPGPVAAATLIERDGRAWHESAQS